MSDRTGFGLGECSQADSLREHRYAVRVYPKRCWSTATKLRLSAARLLILECRGDPCGRPFVVAQLGKGEPCSYHT